MSEIFQIEIVDAKTLHDLRRRVLRGGNPSASVADDRDNDSMSLHLAGILGERIVVVGSFYPSRSPINDEMLSYQLRYLATDFDVQGLRYGATLLRAAESRLASLGAQQLWALARDTALGFYQRVGWSLVEGSEQLSKETGLPHTQIYKVLCSNEPWSLEWATSSDVKQLAALREEMHFAVSLREFSSEWIINSATFFDRGLESGSELVAIARSNSGSVVSCAAASFRLVAPFPSQPLGRIAYIHSVSTRPSFRRRGISRALITALLDELESRGIERVDLHAAPDGEAIYRSLGFDDRHAGVELRKSFVDAVLTVEPTSTD